MVDVLHVVVCRKPIEGTVSENCLQYGTGAINVDGCRVETSEKITTHSRGVNGAFPKVPLAKMQNADQRIGLDMDSERSGRWPANLIVDKSDEVQGLFPNVKAGVAVEPQSKKMNRSIYGETNTLGRCCGFNDSGSASRFFFNFGEQETAEGEQV